MSISIDLEKAKSGEKVSENCFEAFFFELKNNPCLQEAEIIFILNKIDIIHESNKQNKDQIENLFRDTFGARVLGVIDAVAKYSKSNPEAFKKINTLIFESTNRARVKLAQGKKASKKASKKKRFLCF